MEFIIKYKKAILAGLTSLGLLLLIFYVIMVIGNCEFKSSIQKGNEDINAQVQEATNINANIANLEIKKIETQANINAAVANLTVIQKEVTNAQENSNRAAGNVDNVNSRNYNGISPADADRERCRTFPDSFGC